MTDETSTPPPSPSTRYARAALLLACAWVLAGALFKLLAGSPNDLPELVRDFPLLKPTWTFRIAIGVELSIVLVALIRPRVGWVLIVLLFAFFDYLLYKIGAAGETKCGCFGSSAPEWLTPFVMMVIDSVLLLGVLVTRPWSRLRGGKRNLLPLLPVVAVLLALPWMPFFFKEATVQTVVDEETGEEQQVVEGDFHQFTPAEWQDQVFDSVDLMDFLDGVDDPWSAFPMGAPVQVMLYRNSCSHCRAHFEQLMVEPLPAEVQLVLIRVPESGDADNVVDDVKPMTIYADLALVELPRGYGLTTPVIFDIDPETFEIKNVVQGGDEDEDEHGH
jgi:methylamine utilization protein MauE